MLNSVQLIGRLGNDAEVRTLTTGKKVATFRLATDERYTKNGEKKVITTWHTIQTFQEGTIKFLETYCGKGDLVFVSGSIKNEEWTDDNGAKHYATKINISGPKHELKKLNWDNSSDQPDTASDEEIPF